MHFKVCPGDRPDRSISPSQPEHGVPFLVRFAARAAERHTPAKTPYAGLPELEYPFHDRDILVTACGRNGMHRKKSNIATVLAGQRLGIKEVNDGIWLVSVINDDPGYIDLEQSTLQPIDNPFAARLSPMS